jgi:uncharacterized peroxidase-related enzyme
MAYIPVPEGVPGIRSLVQFRPETGRPLYDLVQILLRGPSRLTPAERELIAAYTSSRNECMFCMRSHAAAARCLYGEESQIVDDVIDNGDGQLLTAKMKALLLIAGLTQKNGKDVRQEHIDQAKKAGATDEEIHDTVLIAATFSLFNRYVDGLASFTPTEEKAYEEMGKRMTEKGYVFPTNKT